MPKANAEEASLCLLQKPNRNFKVIGVENLTQTIRYLQGKEAIEPNFPKLEQAPRKNSEQISLGWIKGQEHAKRGLVIAAGGGHNLLPLGAQ